MSFVTIKKQLEAKIKNAYQFDVLLRTDLTSSDIDFYLPLLSYFKDYQQDINLITSELQKICLQCSAVENVFLINGFFNIKLKYLPLFKNILFQIIKNDFAYGSQKIQNQTLILDYSSPNIAKNFSVGHLRSTVIGNSLKKIYQKLGFNVIGINHLGDWGTQFGKIILAYQKWGKMEIIKKDPLSELQRLYVLFHQQAKINPQLNQQASQIFYQLEQKDSQLIFLWQQLKNISLKEFNSVYDLLGVTFDYYIGESFYNNYINDLIVELNQKKLLKFDQNAYIVPLDNLPPVLIKKTNNSTLYLTRDLAALLYRFRQYDCSKILYVVGNEQKLHFSQLQQVVFKMGYNFHITHVNFGLVLLQGKKISTRSDKFIKLRDVIVKMEKLAQHILSIKKTSISNTKEVATKIAIGSLIFNDLKNDRNLNITFDWEKMLQFEGQTGSYLQYTLVRINSLLKKINFEKFLTKDWVQLDINASLYLKTHYLVLIKLLDHFPVILQKTQINNKPSILARYLLQLAKYFNNFYSQEQIIVTDILIKNTNLLLVKAVFIVLKEGLNLLGIPYLEKM